MTDQPTLAQVAQAVRAYRFRYVSEDELQRGLHAALTQAGIPCEREVRLDAACRVDMLCGRVAVEAKTSGSPDATARQLRKYLDTGKIDGVVLVTARVNHLHVAPLVADGRLAIVTLAEAGL